MQYIDKAFEILESESGTIDDSGLESQFIKKDDALEAAGLIVTGIESDLFDLMAKLDEAIEEKEWGDVEKVAAKIKDMYLSI